MGGRVWRCDIENVVANVKLEGGTRIGRFFAFWGHITGVAVEEIAAARWSGGTGLSG